MLSCVLSTSPLAFSWGYPFYHCTQGNYGPEQYTYNATTGNLSSKAGVNYTYGDANHKHAVTSLSNGNSYGYDPNGNMTSRTVSGQSYTLGYDAENRMTSVSGALSASFVYNGDGMRVKSTVAGVTTAFIGNYYEWRGSAAASVKYYYAGSQRIAMRTGSEAPKYLLGDHLGSTSVSVNADGSGLQTQGYYPWGETRFGGVATEYQYTGQYRLASLGLDWYNSRWYDSYLNRWTSPDSIVPLSTQGVQALDRYAYANNNPVRYNDPTGHMISCGDGEAGACGGDTRESIYKEKREYYENCAKGIGLNCPKEELIALWYLSTFTVASADTWLPAVIEGVKDVFIPIGAACTADATCRGLLNALLGVQDSSPGKGPGSPFPSDPAQLKHIFRNATGHLVEDTTANRNLLLETVKQENFIMTDKWGNEVFARILENGMEVWAIVRNGIIQNGGVNPFPWYH